MKAWTIRPQTYRGLDGYNVGGRGDARESIHVHRREDAELIRDALVAERDGHITQAELDAYELLAFGMWESHGVAAILPPVYGMPRAEWDAYGLKG